jgi:hypothetical protein
MREHWQELIPLLFIFPEAEGVGVKDDSAAPDSITSLRQFTNEVIRCLTAFDSPTPALESLTVSTTPDIDTFGQ